MYIILNKSLYLQTWGLVYIYIVWMVMWSVQFAQYVYNDCTLEHELMIHVDYVTESYIHSSGINYQ